MNNQISPVRLDNESLDELATLLQCGELNSQDIDDDLLDAVINSDNK
jgi:hypothetical protein